MPRLLRWTGIAIAGLLVVVAIAAAIVYALSERVLNRTWPVPAISLSLPSDPDSIAEGRRLAVIRGCLAACHGKEGEGKVMFDNPVVARVVAPNLAEAARKYSPEQLAAIIRHGVRPDGRSMVVMPSEAYIALDDADLARIIAFMRTLPPSAGPQQTMAFGPMGRFGLVIGKFRMVARMIAETTTPPEVPGDDAKRGRYLARSTCAGCHAPDLRGATTPEFTSPDLAVVAAYNLDAFARLMKEGVAIGNRQMPTMTPASRDHFALLTDDEIRSLHAYLHGLGAARK